MAETMIRVNGVDLCTDTFGTPGDPAILLVSGAAASMDWWHPDFCRQLAAGGRFVIRYDHRDTGRSICYPPGAPAYTGPDLAADAAALIDNLAGGRAHVAGLSMGGALAQYLAIEHPERIASLILMSTSTGPADDLPPMAERLTAAFADPAPEPDWTDREAVLEYLVELQRPYAGPDMFDEASVRETAARVVERTTNPEASMKNHWLLEGGGHQPPPRSTWHVVVPAILRHTAATA